MDKKPNRVDFGEAFLDGTPDRLRLSFNAWVTIEFIDSGTGERETVLDEGNAFGLNMALWLSKTWVNPSTPAVHYMAVGTGPIPSGYDLFNPPEVVGFDRLQGELFRKRIEARNFVDAFDLPTLEPTTTAAVTVVFEDNEAVGPLQEVGLFGDAGAESPNGGLLTNYKAFPAINKPSGKKMVITWRTLFTL